MVRLSVFAWLVVSKLVLSAVPSGQMDNVPAEAASKLRAEAARFERTSASALFDALSSERGKTSLHLTEEQVEFSRRLDEVVRAILQVNLLRGLDAVPPPTPAELAARLGETGRQERRTVVSHAEAMVLEVILTTRQASHARRVYEVKPAAPLLGRYRASRCSAAEVLSSVSELKGSVEHELRDLRATDAVSSSLFQSFNIFREPPSGQTWGTPSTAQLELRETLKVSAEQVALATRLEQLDCDILLAWMSRKLLADLPRLEDWEAADWYDRRARQRESCIAHAETVLLRGLLSPSQGKVLLAYVWRSMGPTALADPELATQLNLTRRQRSGVVQQLETYRSIRRDTFLHLIGLMESRGQKDEFGRDVAELAKKEKQRVEPEINWIVWSVLTPSQRKELNRILGVNIREPQPAPGS